MQSNSKKIVGYATGVFDLFHIGHVNLLRNAKSMCDTLIVGVTIDELVAYKGKECVIPFAERLEIVRSISYVDLAVPQDNMDKMVAWQKLKYDLLFVGDDWYNTERFQNFEKALLKVGVKTIYFPYTQHTSSTILSAALKNLSKSEVQE